MKKTKLTLDKVNVVRLNAAHTILGGGKPSPNDTDTAGVGVPHSTHCPDAPVNNGGNSDPSDQSISTKRTMPGSSINCLG